MTERRRHVRYSCPGSVSIRSLNTQVRIAGRIADVSQNGCYVETLNPLPSGTQMEMHMDVRGVEFKAIGEVRMVHPSMGMGVEFVQMTADDRHRLDTLIAQISGHQVGVALADPARPAPAAAGRDPLLDAPDDPPPTRPAAPPPVAAPAPAPAAARPLSLDPQQAGRLLQSILQWFQGHESLSKKELQEIWQKTKN